MTTLKKCWPAVALCGALGLWSCDDGRQSPGVVGRAGLQAFSGDNACQDLEAYLEDTAVKQMRTQLEATRDGVPTWGWWGPVAMAEDVTMAGSANGAPRSESAAPTDYTTTNNQVAGVDEADFVKNDGTRIFALAGQTLHAVKSWPAETTALAGKLVIEGYPRELFLEGTDKAIVFSSLYDWYPLSNARGGVLCASLDCGYYSSNTVKVTVVDVSDMTNLKVLSEYYVPGQYNSARKVGSSVRMVMSDNFNFPPGFKWSPEYEEGLYQDKARLKAAYDKIIAANEQLIRQQTLAEWLPAAKVRVNGETTALPQPCGSLFKVNAPTRLGTVSVVTVNMASPSLERSTILAEPGEVYASQKNLYVATRHWWWWPAPGQADVTYLHKFDITNPDTAPYLASGMVDGHIVDQFSMDEAASEHFRVVTTVANRVADPEHPDWWWGRLELTNRLTVLQENAGALEVVGSSGNFAAGETAMSSRILGNKGFVVTFRQVDPLFTFDLTDPTKPTIMGELTIPGFSTYLHPLDDTHLLTIGSGGADSSWVQLAIFDVGDLTNPKQTFTHSVGQSYGWSEAMYEHKAFNYFPAKKLLAIPFASWTSSWSGEQYWSGFTSDLRVYSVDPLTGFTPRGAVSLSDMYQVQRYSNWAYYWTPAVRRSVMADDYVYAISDSGLRVANVVDLAAPLATVRFDHYQP